MLKLEAHCDLWRKGVKFTLMRVPPVASHTQQSWHRKEIRLQKGKRTTIQSGIFPPFSPWLYPPPDPLMRKTRICREEYDLLQSHLSELGTIMVNGTSQQQQCLINATLTSAVDIAHCLPSDFLPA